MPLIISTSDRISSKLIHFQGNYLRPKISSENILIPSDSIPSELDLFPVVINILLKLKDL